MEIYAQERLKCVASIDDDGEKLKNDNHYCSSCRREQNNDGNGILLLLWKDSKSWDC